MILIIFILILVLIIFQNYESINVEGLNDYKFKIEYLKCLKIYNDCKRCEGWEKRIRDPVFIELSKNKFCNIKNNEDCKLIECIKQNGCVNCKKLVDLFGNKKHMKKLYDLYCKIEKFESKKNISQKEFENNYFKYLNKRKKDYDFKTKLLDFEYCLKNQGCTEHCKQYRNILPKNIYYDIKHKTCPQSKFIDSTEQENYFKSRHIKLNY